ncbi:hypothetical protein POJ06DRAFT_286952 [Lipomyces tetrasporus]|uniref:Alcohol acetyltransferase n=1 Tax=Lipomyces tetrasporus TaxID=54092 RepID=A0AAD7VP58_9ASCO|nr:uncharacterized protein POJ06DRAFT_286952 [Lipomyces tetrasporus]KAJ8096668.1 hypothetical protein POJ06DRAFT_286952 [Lipomyces tetrasporus]
MHLAAPAEFRNSTICETPEPNLQQRLGIAVVDTIMRHPMLQVGMMDATSKTPSWIQLQSLDLTHHIKWPDLGEHEDFEQTVQETFRAQLDDRFQDVTIKQPGWKITIFRQGNAPIMEVLLTWNHPQFDGAGPLQGIWEETRPQFFNRDKSWAAWCPIRTSPYKTHYRAFFMDNVSLVAILALCRQNKTTITGLLNGLALIAFSLRLDSTVAPAFQSSTVMDHRRNLPPAPPDAPWVRSDRAVGNYVTQCLHRYETELVARIRSKLPADASEGRDLSADLQRELWAVSAQNRQEIVGKLETGLRNDLVGLFKYVTNWQQTMSKMAKRTRQFTWLVTNIGVLDGNTSTRLGTTTTRSPTGGDSKSDDGQRWSIDRAQFGLSAEIPAAAIEFAPVSVAGQGMCISANWPDCAVDETFGENIMADLERWLAQLASL